MIEKFLQYIESERRCSPHTLRAYRHDLENFLRYLKIKSEKFDPSLIHPEDIREWLIESSENQESKSTSVNRRLSSLRSFFHWAHAKGHTLRNPVTAVRSLKVGRRLPTFVSRGAITKMIEEQQDSGTDTDFIELRNALIILTFYATGIRLSELHDIQWNDFSGSRDSLKVRGKGDKERLVPIIVPLKEAIAEYETKIKEENIWKSGVNSLFLSRNGEPLSRGMIYRIVRKELSEAKIQGRKSPHVLRHTFATHLLNGGADMRDIQELMGHSSLQSTQIYTHNSISHLQNAYAAAHPRARSKDGKKGIEPEKDIGET